MICPYAYQCSRNKNKLNYQILRTYVASVTKTKGHPIKMKADIFLFLQGEHWQFPRLNPGYLCSAMRVYQPTLQQHSRL
jgi:hypothetical protein